MRTMYRSHSVANKSLLEVNSNGKTPQSKQVRRPANNVCQFGFRGKKHKTGIPLLPLQRGGIWYVWIKPLRDGVPTSLWAKRGALGGSGEVFLLAV